MPFTDLEEFLEENLGFKTLDDQITKALESREAATLAFFARKQAWYKANPEAHKAWRRAYYHKHMKDPVWALQRKLYNRQWARDNKDKISRRDKKARAKKKAVSKLKRFKLKLKKKVSTKRKPWTKFTTVQQQRKKKND